MPDESVAAEEAAVFLCEFGDYFAHGEIEFVFFGLGCEPLFILSDSISQSEIVDVTFCPLLPTN